MTTEEIKQKLDDANARVQKRIGTMTKLCNKGGVNVDDVLAKFNTYYDANKKTATYLPSRVAKELVSGFAWANDEDHSYDYEVSENLQKLYELKIVADNWEVKYNKSSNFDNEEKIPVLVEFLERWKALAKSWYMENANEYLKLKQNEKKKMEADFNELSKDDKEYFEKYRGRWWKSDWEARWRQDYYSDIQSLTRDIARLRGHSVGDWGDREYVYDSVEVDEDKLDKVLETEKKAKYKDLVHRITAEVGEITDVAHLHIAPTGQLNGRVEGTKGKASIETVGAGGYAIQCFHYRTLIHKIKN